MSIQQNSFPTSQEEAIKALEDFLPRAGESYARERNFDYGPAERQNVSQLSPMIRRRLLPEWMVIEETLKKFSFITAEKFIQEICWRSYWKGWLQNHPWVWSNYLGELSELKSSMNASTESAYHQAISGETDIECFNAWIRELVETGYLHNHARMWTASIWIHSLNLPWALGADLFYRHLLDGDPASNTLSWRWVAGLQTKGKAYLARAENIEKCTKGRFTPTKPLADTPVNIEDFELDRTKQKRFDGPLRELPEKSPCKWLIHSEDLHSLETEISKYNVESVIAISLADLDCGIKFSEPLIRYDEKCVQAAIKNSTQKSGLALERGLGSMTEGDHIAMFEPTMGPLRSAVMNQAREVGAQLHFFRRPWDTKVYPLATKGFFPFWKKLSKKLKAGAL